MKFVRWSLAFLALLLPLARANSPGNVPGYDPTSLLGEVRDREPLWRVGGGWKGPAAPPARPGATPNHTDPTRRTPAHGTATPPPAHGTPAVNPRGRAIDGSASPIRKTHARAEAFAAVVARELGSETSALAAARNNPALREALRNPQLIREMRFEQVGNEIVLRIDHRAFPEATLEVRGDATIRALLQEAGIHATSPAELAARAPLYQHTAAPYLGDSDYVFRVGAGAQEMFLLASRTAQSSPVTPLPLRTMIEVDPATGFPKRGGTRIPISISHEGNAGAERSTTETWRRDGTGALPLGPAQAANFERFLRSMSRAPQAPGRESAPAEIVNRVTRPSSDTSLARNATPHQIVLLNESPFRSSAERDALSRRYGETLTSEALSGHEYERRAVDFANRTTGPVVTHESEGTKIKMHLETGEFLVVTPRGQIAAYARLPVGSAALANFENSHDIGNRLSEPVRHATADGTPRSFAGLEAGTAVEARHFADEANREKHFRKHVLGVSETYDLSRGDFPRPAGDRYEFPDLRDRFQDQWSRLPTRHGPERTRALTELIQEFAAEYEERAVAFANSTAPTILTRTQSEPHPIAYRFDLVTHQMMLIDRRTGDILTFYKAQSDTETLNAYLQNQREGLPPIRNPLEYFLSQSTTRRGTGKAPDTEKSIPPSPPPPIAAPTAEPRSFTVPSGPIAMPGLYPARRTWRSVPGATGSPFQRGR